MKTAMIIWNLVCFISIFANFGIATTKRRNPGPNEIERVINETHSVMWICKKAECPPGLGLNVHCGTSIPFSMPIKCVSCVEGVNFSDTTHSTCKGCKICGKNEKKTGKCTLEEDTTNCSGICYKGFYMDAISGECHPCSDCCGQSDKYHEKQCEDSGLPSSKQCRVHNLKCFETTTKSSAESKDHDKDQKGLEVSEIVAIGFGIIVFTAIVIFGILIVRYGWDAIRSTFVTFFCYCCHLEASNGQGNTMYFDGADGQVQRYEHDPQQGTGKSEHNFTGTPERTTDPELSDLLDQYQIQFRPPAKTEKTQRGFSRSFSHPGALNPILQKETSNSNCIPLQCFGSPKPKKLLWKREYSLVAAELSDEAVFTRNSSMSTIARVQPVKPERFAKSLVKTQHTSTNGLYLAVTSETSLNGIPQDFQNNLLSKKMSSIPYKYYSRICVKLNIKRFAFDDFRLLAEEIGFTRDFILWFGQLENPTDQIITKYNTQEGSCVGKFREMLEGMKRSDVVDIIDEWVQYEWLKQCDSSTVNRRPKTYV
ncbi:uncharacterized protein LOC111324497 [Stylophora pistillata]|uniref:TNFR-Cys domain-containing protein n=1 Tax=Stylophora pistillata TaxID=50429 RepID=A0A2B4SGB2_STYPI|nr:uncharacterized protein LOC111324497 [Stylophora pistillata]XP_022783804.1 uncharacterized protein LOC111324497 [Stylophora pistillata]PFX29734.1 hypothetical protein AWC38_SpisGene5476 [Stylophora pistillata]